MRIPRFLVTVPYLHSYDLSDLFYHNGRGMVKLNQVSDLMCGCCPGTMIECLLYVLKYLKIRKNSIKYS